MWILMLSLFAFAGEPDNFSGRNTPPQNEVVNSYYQHRLKEIAFYHNSNNKGASTCNEELLTKLVEKTFDTNWPDVKGLYWNVKKDGPSGVEGNVLEGTMLPIFINPSVTLKLQGQHYSVGLDKIDHLFSHGYMYWKIIGKDPTLPKDEVLKALNFGVEQERAAWGLKSSGVKSYGDLAANYQGLRFWRDFRHGKPPFLSCVKGKIEVKRQFKVEDYLTGAVDEGLNCSSYASAEMAKKILQRTEALGRKCPLDMKQCQQFQKDLPAEFAEYLLHPLCRGESSNQIEPATQLTTKELMDLGNALSPEGQKNLMDTFFPSEQRNIRVQGSKGKLQNLQQPKEGKAHENPPPPEGTR